MNTHIIATGVMTSEMLNVFYEQINPKAKMISCGLIRAHPYAISKSMCIIKIEEFQVLVTSFSIRIVRQAGVKRAKCLVSIPEMCSGWSSTTGWKTAVIHVHLEIPTIFTGWNSMYVWLVLCNVHSLQDLLQGDHMPLHHSVKGNL